MHTQLRASHVLRGRARASAVIALVGCLVVAIDMGCRTVAAQAGVRVQTRDGVSFLLPAGFHELSTPALAESLPGAFESAYADATTSAVQVIVARSVVQRQTSLPMPSPEITDGYREGFLASAQSTLQLTEIYDVGLGAYHPDRGAFSMQFKTRGPSYAGRLLSDSDASASWAEIRRAGAEPLQLRCVLSQLLGGAKSATLADLPPRYDATTRACGWSSARLAQYVRESGAAVFSPVETANTSVAFFTRDASVQVMVVAPLSRALAVEHVAAQILGSSQIAAAVRLEASFFHERGDLSSLAIGKLLGAVLGSACIVVVLAALFALLLRRLSLSVWSSVVCSLGVVALSMSCLVIVAALREQVLSLFALLQLASYAATSLLALRPLRKWLERRDGLLPT